VATSYDAWGNLLQKNVTKCSAETLAVAALTNNRLSGYSYDAAGNMLSDGFHNYAYNADGMLTSVDSGAATYQYGSGGERIRKNTAAGATEYVYFGGNAIAERNVATGYWTDYIFANGRLARRDPSGAVHYYLGDHLGSTSMVVSAAGAIENESEFYPFGGELQFSASADNHYKFTGKERDTESGLDYFGARYYNSTLGRWISADWSAVPAPVPYADFADPQSLNLYSYVRNLPTTRVDADGHQFCIPCVEKVGEEIAESPEGKAVLDKLSWLASAAAATAASAWTASREAVETYGRVEPTGNLILDALNPPNVFPEVMQPTVQNANTAAQGQANAQGNAAQPGGEAGSRPGKDFTPAGKRAIDQRDQGQCKDCGTQTRQVQDKRGQPSPADQRHRHHVDPKSKGGSGTIENAETLCRACHVKKHREMRQQENNQK
jgi:RHS repeat-associated protein